MVIIGKSTYLWWSQLGVLLNVTTITQSQFAQLTTIIKAYFG